MQIDKLRKCFDEGIRNGERHKGLRKIRLGVQEAEQHMQKAIHNFEAISEFRKINFSDWSASAAFYTLYHGLLAILCLDGYESRNQSCTFAYIAKMIQEEQLHSLSEEDIKEIVDFDVTHDLEHSSSFLDIRETMQYSAKTSMKDEAFESLKKRTNVLLNKIQLDYEKLLSKKMDK